MSGFRPAARLARREVTRRPGRSVLVALLVAAPVAAMLVGGVLVRTEHISPLERWNSVNGQADAVVETGNVGLPATQRAALRTLTAVHSVVTEQDLSTRVLKTVDGHRSESWVAVVPMRDPLTRGRFVVTAGRGASAPDEAFLTRAAARALAVRVGQELRLTEPVRRTFRVTGVGEEAAQFGESEIVVSSASAWGAALPDASKSTLVELPQGVSVARLSRLSDDLSSSTTAQWALQISPRLLPVDNHFVEADAETKVRWSWLLGAVGLTVTGIVIAAAFAVGARRQLAALGVLAGTGASPRFLTLVLVLQGMWTGLLGSVLGVGLGAGALALLRSHRDEVFGHVAGGYVLRAADLIPIVVLGVVAATIAAAVPARTATRVPVLAALAGRRPLGRVPAWLPAVGVGMVVVGLALFDQAVDNSARGTNKSNSVLIQAIIGCVLTLLGGCAIAPALVSLLERIATRTFGAVRVATRSLARQRTRTAAVVSAVAATGALAIGGSALVLGQHAARVHKAQWIAPNQIAVSGSYRSDGSSPPPDALVEAVARVVPHATPVVVRMVANNRLAWTVQSVSPRFEPDFGMYVGNGALMNPSITIADPATLDLYRLSSSERRALQRDGWLIFGVSNGEIGFTLGTRGPDNPTVTMAKPIATVHAELLSGLDHEARGTQLMITPARAAQLHLPSGVESIVLRAPSALTSAQRTTILDLQNGTAAIEMYRPPVRVSPFLGEWALVGIALALVLFVVAVNLGLSAAEARDERDVLTVVGAAPGAMARTSGYKAVILTVMGALMAIPIGFLPVAIFVHASPGVIPLVFPWRVVTLLVLAVPLVGGAIVVAGSAAALRLRPVRISTMAYD